MPIKTPWSYAKVAKLNRENAAFTQAQYQNLVFSCTKDPILARLLSLFPPETCHNASFKTKYNRAVARYREMLQRQNHPTNVHDPLFGGIREKTKAWLQKTVASLPVSSSTTSSSSSSSSASSASGSSSLVDTLVKSFGAFLSSKAETKKDQEAFFGYLAQSYEKGSTGKQSLEQALAYCAHCETKEKKEDSYKILFVSLEQARTAYEGSSHKYVTAAHPFSHKKARDWSCMPGVEERILDGCTPWFEAATAKTQAAASSTTETDFIAPLVEQLVHPFLSKQAQGLVPTKAFYSLVVQAVAQHFRWQVEVNELDEYQLLLNEQQQEQYKQAFLKQQEQKKQQAEQLLKKLKTDEDLSAFSEKEKTALSSFSVPGAPLVSVRNDLQYYLDHYTAETSEKELAEKLQELLKRRYSSQEEAAQQLKIFSSEEMKSLLKAVKVTKLGFSKTASSSSNSVRSTKDEEGSNPIIQSSSSSDEREILQEEEPEDTLATLDSQRLLSLLQTTTPQLSSEHWQLLAHLLPFETFREYLLEGKTDCFEPSLKIDSFLSTLQDQLLAAELQTQAQIRAQTHTPFYRYYAHATPALLKHIQNQILAEIRQVDVGLDYFYNLLVPCQEALMTEVIPACLDELAKGSREQQGLAKFGLPYWLAVRGYHLATSLCYLVTAKLDTPDNRKALLAAGANAKAVAQSLRTLSGEMLLTPENCQTVLAAGANARAVRDGLYKLGIKLTQDNFQTLVNAGANAKIVARGLSYLAGAQLLTPENRQALVNAGANAAEVRCGLDRLQRANILTQDNFQALVNAGANAKKVAEGLSYLAEVKLLTLENRQELIDAGANAEAVAQGLWRLNLENILTQENFQALLAAGANAEKVAKEAADFYDWQRYSILKKSLLATLIIGIVSVISFSLLAAAVLTTLLGTGLFLVLHLRLRQLLPFMMNAIAQKLTEPSSSVLGDPMFIFGKQSAFNTLSGFANYCRSFCNKEAYSTKWHQGFAEGCREQWKKGLKS